MNREERYPYVVVPGPGMYGNGQIKVISRHATQEAAEAAARRRTDELQRAMGAHGGTSGYYYAARYPKDSFWADMPPSAACDD